jgi:hypothetical protein
MDLRGDERDQACDAGSGNGQCSSTPPSAEGSHPSDDRPGDQGKGDDNDQVREDVNCVHVRMARLEDQDRSGDHDRDDGRAHEGAR